MDYSKIEQRGDDLVICRIKNFILSQILDNGQAFRWSANNDNGGFSGIAHGRRLDLEIQNGDLILKNVSKQEYESLWQNYFDLSRSYDDLRCRFQIDETLQKALAYSPGLRIMKQDPWETLITFILSQNSNIPRIKGMVSRLCECFGKLLPCGGYTFPDAAALAKLTNTDLSDIRTGYRAAYIIDAARRVYDGRLDLTELSQKTSEDVRKALLEIHGVGPKVADCVLLFGFGRVEYFPLDVWMKKVMSEHYPSGFPKELADTAGIAQQFLFHYVRTSSN